jgi:hypothetical protein
VSSEHSRTRQEQGGVTNARQLVHRHPTSHCQPHHQPGLGFLPPAGDQTPARPRLRTRVLTCPDAPGRPPTHREPSGRVDDVTESVRRRCHAHRTPLCPSLEEHHLMIEYRLIPLAGAHRAMHGRPLGRPDTDVTIRRRGTETRRATWDDHSAMNGAAGSCAPADLAVGVMLLPEIGKRREYIVRLVYYSLRSRKAAEIWIGPISRSIECPDRGRSGRGAEMTPRRTSRRSPRSRVEEGLATCSDLVFPGRSRGRGRRRPDRGLDARTPLDLAWT